MITLIHQRLNEKTSQLINWPSRINDVEDFALHCYWP